LSPPILLSSSVQVMFDVFTVWLVGICSRLINAKFLCSLTELVIEVIKIPASDILKYVGIYNCVSQNK
jgi:hypothetical protein